MPSLHLRIGCRWETLGRDLFGEKASCSWTWHVVHLHRSLDVRSMFMWTEQHLQSLPAHEAIIGQTW